MILAAASMQPPPLPFEAGSGLPGVSGLAYMAGILLLICVGAYFSVRFLYGRGFQGRLGVGKRFIRVLDRYPLAPQRFLLVVEAGGKFFLLGVTEQSISCLTPLDAEALAKDIEWMDQNPPAGFSPFNSYLSALSRRWRKDKKEPSNE